MYLKISQKLQMISQLQLWSCRDLYLNLDFVSLSAVTLGKVLTSEPQSSHLKMGIISTVKNCED